jgi:hypothetical protein
MMPMSGSVSSRSLGNTYEANGWRRFDELAQTVAHRIDNTDDDLFLEVAGERKYCAADLLEKGRVSLFVVLPTEPI